MTPKPSPWNADDFCLVGNDDLFALPIRSRSERTIDQQAITQQNVEEDYDIISRPGSVRSFGSPSPSPATPRDDPTALIPSAGSTQSSSVPCSCGRRMPPFAPCVRCTGQNPSLALPSINIPPGRVTLSKLPDRTASNTGCDLPRLSAAKQYYLNRISSGQLDNVKKVLHISTPVPLHTTGYQATRPVDNANDELYNHESLDRAIMDQLLSHAIELHTKAEAQGGHLNKAQLAMKMLIRLLKLPPNHRVSQELLKLQPNLFHPLYREATERRAIFDKVFTGVEQAALYAIHQGHKCTFKRACVFEDCFGPELDWVSSILYSASIDDLKAAGLLASEVQMSCVNDLSYIKVLQFLPIGGRSYSDWQPETASNINRGISEDRDAMALYAADQPTYRSVESFVIVRFLNLAIPDLVSLKLLHESTTKPAPRPSKSPRLKREASNEDLSANGLASPPWKRISLQQRLDLPKLATRFSEYPDGTRYVCPRQTELSLNGHPSSPQIQSTDSMNGMPTTNYMGYGPLDSADRESVRNAGGPTNSEAIHIKKLDYAEQLRVLENQNQRRLAMANRGQDKLSAQHAGQQQRDNQVQQAQQQKAQSDQAEQRKRQATSIGEYLDMCAETSDMTQEDYKLGMMYLEQQGKQRWDLAKVEVEYSPYTEAEKKQYTDAIIQLGKASSETFSLVMMERKQDFRGMSSAEIAEKKAAKQALMDQAYRRAHEINQLVIQRSGDLKWKMSSSNFAMDPMKLMHSAKPDKPLTRSIEQHEPWIAMEMSQQEYSYTLMEMEATNQIRLAVTRVESCAQYSEKWKRDYATAIEKLVEANRKRVCLAMEERRSRRPDWKGDPTEELTRQKAVQQQLVDEATHKAMNINHCVAARAGAFERMTTHYSTGFERTEQTDDDRTSSQPEWQRQIDMLKKLKRLAADRPEL